MADIIDLDAHRLKRRVSRDPDMNVASCMYCGAEFPWGRRHDHRCNESSMALHPSMQ